MVRLDSLGAVARMMAWSIVAMIVASARMAADAIKWKDFPEHAAFELPANAVPRPVALRWAGGWVLAKVEINGTDVGWFKLATGWRGSLIDREVAIRLKLPALPESGLLTRTDSESGGVRLVRIDRLACGGAVAEDVALECADLSGLSGEVEKIYGEGIAGVLGWDLMGTLPFLLDEPRLSMIWQKRAEAPEKAERLDLSIRGGCPYAPVKLGESCETEAMVNTAAVSMAVQRPFLVRHESDGIWNGPLISLGSAYFGLPGDDDGLPLGDAVQMMRTSRWMEVGIGGVREAQPAAISPRADPEAGEVQVGYGLFRKRVVLMDGPGKALWLAPSDTVPEVTVAESENPPAYLLTVAMQSAVDFNDPVAVKAVAKAGADIKGLPRQEPLARACSMGSRAAAEALLKAGAPAEPDLDRPGLPLLSACEIGDAKLVSRLLDKGADPMRGNLSRLTPLLAAARNGNADGIATILAKTKLPEDAPGLARLLGEAVSGGNVKFAKEVFGKFPADAKKDVPWPDLLGRACLLGEVEMAEWILETGGKEIVTESSRFPPLIAAILPTRIGKTDAVRERLAGILLDAGADPNVVCKGVTPLLMAARHGNAAIIGRLRDAGGKTGATDAKQRTTLLRAAIANQPAEVVSALLDKRVDPDAMDPETEMTALAIHAATGNAAACRVLMDAGAGLEAVSMFGSSPLAVASNSKRCPQEDSLEVVKLLLERGAKARHGEGREEAPEPLFGAAVAGRSMLIEPLVKAGCSVDRSVGGESPLAWACAMADPETVLALLENKAPTDAADRSGVTPLGHAAAAGRVGNLKVMLENGVAPDAAAEGGVPPVWLAAAAGQARALRLLLAAGARADAKHPVRETTALDVARARGDRRIVAIIEKSAGK
ncbi:MAG: ankyrin repeat domain-containing protein [Verrucomicrobia bacterium]|nr:ankyrin repeat domain-containing protein [Verrucomicrobiota bacterium]